MLFPKTLNVLDFMEFGIGERIKDTCQITVGNKDNKSLSILVK